MKLTMTLFVVPDMLTKVSLVMYPAPFTMCGNVVTTVEFGIGALLIKATLSCILPPSPLVAVITGGAVPGLSGQERGIVMEAKFDVPPPDEGLNTVMNPLPIALTSAAVKATIRTLLLTNWVVRAAPFHCTSDAETKFDPFTL